MEIIVKLNSLEDFKIIDNANSYLLANKNFSYRFEHSFNINEIKKIINLSHKTNKKTYILVNKIFFDDDLPKLEEFMIKLISLSIDGFFFTDFAVFMLACKYNYQDKCFFYHETFLRNTYDIKTYQDLGIKNIIVSKDMGLIDILKLPKERKENYGILLFGYFPIYESKRKVLTNFIKQNKLDKNLINNMNLSIKEENKNHKYKIIEQEGVSSIFNDEILNYLPYLDKLKENINMFIIDSLFFDAFYIKDIVDVIIKSKDPNSIIKPDLKYSDVFLNNKVGLI